MIKSSLKNTKNDAIILYDIITEPVRTASIKYTVIQWSSFFADVMEYYITSFFFRFLASGDSVKTVAYFFRIGDTTALNIIYETCIVLWRTLQPMVKIDTFMIRLSDHM